MKQFALGVVVGIFAKKYIHTSVCIGLEYFHNVRNSLKQPSKKCFPVLSMDFVCKVKNQERFDEILRSDEYKHKKKLMFQPNIEYYPDHHLFRSEIDDLDRINKYINDKEDFLSTIDDLDTSLDLELFRSLGDIFIFITYIYHDKKYTTVYHDGAIINSNDFILNKGTSFYENFSDIICANIKYSDHTEYLTSYFKQFVNNTCSLTPELILYNYPLIDKIEKEYTLVILKNNKMLRYLKTQELK
jgi:hypothetical protein